MVEINKAKEKKLSDDGFETVFQLSDIDLGDHKVYYQERVSEDSDGNPFVQDRQIAFTDKPNLIHIHPIPLTLVRKENGEVEFDYRYFPETVLMTAQVGEVVKACEERYAEHIV